MAQRTLRQALDEWLTLTQGRYMPNTQRSNRNVTNAFVRVVGDIQLRHLSHTHMEQYFYSYPNGVTYTKKASTANLHRAVLLAFVKYALNRGWLRVNPMINVRPMKVEEAPRTRLTREQLDRALELARHPRDRVFLSLAMNTGMRVSELLSLTIGDVNLELGEIACKIHKTKKTDAFPISAELDEELRKWFRFYQAKVGPLQPQYVLLPAKAARGIVGKNEFALEPEEVALRPERSMGYPKYLLRYVFDGLGIKDKGAGAHTFRRSVARLYYDRMVAEEGSKDHALRLTRVLLNHSTTDTTERYIGVEREKMERNASIRGKSIFGDRPDNVVKLRVVE